MMSCELLTIEDDALFMFQEKKYKSRHLRKWKGNDNTMFLIWFL